MLNLHVDGKKLSKIQDTRNFFSDQKNITHYNCIAKYILHNRSSTITNVSV